RTRIAVVREGGRPAATRYEVVETFEGPGGKALASLVRLTLETGRTHQIRVHMKESLGCPILGDEIYAQPSRQSVQPGRLMLHARFLTFTHPETKERLTFESPLPSEFRPFVPEGGI
ncbi:MAG: RluA family pseudouridine synthase, partial [Verrucomicrobiae bacterium]|nr:RluA family pseudouridine synthase [Verrucomicrobiae bacterium]